MEKLRKPSGLRDLEPGDHLCCIYRSEEEHRALIAPYLRQGLEKGEKVLYIADSHTAEEVLGYLKDDGIDPEPYLAGGQLSILSAGEAYMKAEEFDPGGMIALLREETELALAQGYGALRVTGEMSWALRGFPGSERLIEYEAELNRFFPGSRCLAICQYDRRRFDANTLLDVLTTHPLAVVGTEIFDNFYYIPPDEFIGEVLADDTLERRIRNLRTHRDNLRKLKEKEDSERAILEESRERWRRSFDVIGDPMMVLDGEMRILQHNGALAELLGRGGEDFTGRRCYELVHGLASPPDFCVCAEAWEKKGRVKKDLYERSLGKHLMVSFSPVFDQRGEMEFGVHVIQDISERKRMEEDLRESEEKFRSIVEQSSDGIVLADGSGTVIEWNSAQESIVGMRREEALGKPLWEVQYLLALPEEKTPELHDRLKRSVLDSLERGYASWFGETSERELQSPDGERRIVQAVAFPIRSREGMMVGIITRDITRRVRMEKALSFELEVNKALAELSAALLAQASIEDVSYIVLENAKRLTASPFGYVGYIESETGYLISPTLTRDIWEECGIADKSVVFKDFKGLWGWVLKHRKPLLTNRPGEDPRSTGVPEGHIPIERFVSVPALLGGALVGQIALANSDRDYDEGDVTLLSRLADLYAVAVLRMWSEEELQHYREHLEELVRERTRELERTNRQLQQEIAERRKSQEELAATAERLRALTAYMESVREEERRRIAREVHDTLGQSLTGLKINLSLLGKKLAGDGELRERVEAMSGLVDSTIESVRAIATQLRPGVLDDLGLAAALEWQAKRFGELTGLDYGFVSRAEEALLSGEISVALFRIAQEALTNVARHAGASRVDILLTTGEEDVVLEIKDNGRGIAAEEIDGRSSLGILGMRERARILGGEVEIRGADGGTTLRVRIPIDGGRRGNTDGRNGEAGS